MILLDKPTYVSPVNGQPLPKGRQFTSESAREARRKRTAKDKERASIANAFRENLQKIFTNKNGTEMTGAEIIAQSIFKGADNGNAKMVEIALALIGEKPAENVNISMGDPSVMEEVRRRMDGEDA